MSESDNPFSRIEKKFGTARHIGWDFAANGDWAHSKSFLLGEQKSPDDVFSWLGEQTEMARNKNEKPDIACEALFQSENSFGFFIGVGTFHLPDDERKRVIGAFVTMPQEDRPLFKTVEAIRDIFGTKLPLDTTPQCLFLGVGGLWRNVGELCVWRRGSENKTILPFEQIKNRAPEPTAGFARLYQAQPKNIIMETHLGSEGSFRCWMGIPVSTFEEGPPPRYTLSESAYRSVANALVPGVA